jgi:hypothetical protein
MATAPMPVAFLHWSSERSWAVELKRMSAHCGSVSLIQTGHGVWRKKGWWN